MTPFTYQALHDSNRIRIIDLLPAPDRGKPIIIKLSEYSINSRFKYEALSYTWDDQIPNRDIICNEKSLCVTENVFQALLRLRSNKARKRTLWIDAICINQEDKLEKTSQVLMMGDIYAHAQSVNIWLSHSTESMRAVFEYVRLTNSPKLSFENVPDEYIAILMDGLQKISSHAYWTRVWTVQEVALSKDCWIYLGQLKPLKLLDFAAMLYEVEGYMNKRSEEIASPDSEYLYPVSYKRGSPSSATILHQTLKPKNSTTGQIDGDTLKHLMGKKAKVPLDVIFAYRALFPKTIGKIKVDYDRNLIDVLKESTVRIIPSLKKLDDLLEVVSHCSSLPGAPSWILNITGGQYAWNASHYFGTWFAARNFKVSSASAPKTHWISSDMDTLFVKGIIFDHTVLVSEVFPQYKLKDQNIWHEKVLAMLTHWRMCSQSMVNIGFDESLVDILFAARIAAEEMAGKIGQTHRFEKVFIYDNDDKKLLNNSLFKIHKVKNPPDTNIQAIEMAKKKRARIFAFNEWLNDPDIPYRLDHEEILSSVHSNGYCEPTTHVPALSGRNLFITSNGKMALGKNIQRGDVVALLAGCDVPFALRPVPGRETYILGQPVLLPGVMSGEAWPGDHDETLVEIQIV